MRHSVSYVMMACGLSLCMAGVAQAGGRYFSAEMGINIAPAVEEAGSSNDLASHCDVFSNPTPPVNPGFGSYPSGCLEGDFRYPGHNTLFPDDISDFDGTIGILAGTALGYSFEDAYPNSLVGGLRLEAEYFYREARYDQKVKIGRASGASLQKINRGEFGAGPFSRLGSVTSHNLFGNMYYDLRNMDWLTRVVGRVGSRLTPYIGIGGGLGFTDVGWHNEWSRTGVATLRQGLRDDGRADLAAETPGPVMRTVPGAAAPESYTVTADDVTRNTAYLNNLANTSSIATATLSDLLYGFQVLLGLDYAVTDVMSMGLKGRWVHFASFDDSLVWNPLRGHIPYVGGTMDDPTRPVHGRVATDDVGFFAVSLNMKYDF